MVKLVFCIQTSKPLEKMMNSLKPNLENVINKRSEYKNIVTEYKVTLAVAKSKYSQVVSKALLRPIKL